MKWSQIITKLLAFEIEAHFLGETDEKVKLAAVLHP